MYLLVALWHVVIKPAKPILQGLKSGHLFPLKFYVLTGLLHALDLKGVSAGSISVLLQFTFVVVMYFPSGTNLILEVNTFFVLGFISVNFYLTMRFTELFHLLL